MRYSSPHSIMNYLFDMIVNNFKFCFTEFQKAGDNKKDSWDERSELCSLKVYLLAVIYMYSVFFETCKFLMSIV